MDKTNPLISIIIAAYNAEQHIGELFESLYAQIYKNIEIIVVNDGSSDLTSEIIEKNKSIDNRIQLINQENAGVSAARNRGLFIAKGDYVIFIDADDIMDKYMIVRLVENAQKTNADISICNIKCCKNIEEAKCANRINDCIKIEKNDALKKFLLGRDIKSGAWNKLIKRNLLDGIYFEEGRKMNEDKYFCFQLLLKCKNLVYTSDSLYYYMEREDSATSASFSSRWFDTVYFADKIYNELLNTSLEIYARYAKLITYYSLVKLLLETNNKDEYILEYNEIIKKIRNIKLKKIYGFIEKSTILGILMIKSCLSVFEYTVKISIRRRN